jgi:hypothetical protein
MKAAKTFLSILILTSICCSYAIGQSDSPIGAIGTISNRGNGSLSKVPVGLISNGETVHPVGEVSNGATVYLGGIRIGSAVYPSGVVSNGATVYLGGVRNGSSVSL